MSDKPRFSVSTWSLHRALGSTYPDSPAGGSSGPVPTYGVGSVGLLDIPAQIAERGIHTLEICHFHLPRHDTAFLRDLRAALDAAGVQLFSLLIDAGDITHPEHGERDLQWIQGWIDVAARLGAERARVIAGKAEPSEAALAKSVAGMQRLAVHAEAVGVRLMTENWFSLLSTPDYVRRLLRQLDKRVGLCADFGNWQGDDKYERLAQIFPLAESCHAKCAFPEPSQPDRDDYIRCLELTRAADFRGPYTLIYDGPDDDEWSGLQIEMDMVRPYLS